MRTWRFLSPYEALKAELGQIVPITIDSLRESLFKPHSEVLAVTVRRGPRSGPRGVSKGCIATPTCPECGKPIRVCDCLAGLDY